MSDIQCTTPGCENFSVSGGKCHDCISENQSARVIEFTAPYCPICKTHTDTQRKVFHDELWIAHASYKTKKVDAFFRTGLSGLVIENSREMMNDMKLKKS